MKIEEISTVTNTFYVGLKDKAVVRVAGIIKAIEDKETSSGTAKRFKGDLAVEYDETTYRARYGFFPAAMRDALISAAAKLGKWSSFEFVLEAKKNAPENAAATWSVSFPLPPRVEMPRVLALLEE